MSLPARHSDEHKARAYDMLTGFQMADELPLEQKAERWDRKAAKHRASWQAGGDRGAYRFDRVDAACWCECGAGNLKGCDGCVCDAEVAA